MVRRTSHNTSYSSGVTRPRGIFNAVVKAVGAGVNPAISVIIPRIGLNNIYENVPVIGPTPLVDDNIYVGFMEGNSSAPVAFTSFDDTVGDIDQVIAGTNLNGGGNTADVTLKFGS